MDWWTSIKDNIFVIGIASIIGSVIITLISDLIKSYIQRSFSSISNKLSQKKLDDLKQRLILLQEINNDKFIGIYHIVYYINILLAYALYSIVCIILSSTAIVILFIMIDNNVAIIAAALAGIGFLLATNFFIVALETGQELHTLIHGVLFFTEDAPLLENEIKALESAKSKA